MTLYKTTLIFAEILSIILAGIWIIYKVKAMQVDDLRSHWKFNRTGFQRFVIIKE